MSEAYTSELERQVQELKVLMKQRNDKVSELTGRNMELEAHIAAMREKIKDYEMQLKQNDEIVDQMRDLQSENARMTKENQMLTKSLTEKELIVAESQPKMRKMQNAIEDLRNDLRKEMDRNKFMHQCVRRANECEALVKKWESDIKKKDDEIDELKNRVAEQKRQLLNEKLANRRLQDDLEASGSLREQCDKLHKENASLKESLEKKQKKVARQTNMLNDAHRMMHAFFRVNDAENGNGHGHGHGHGNGNGNGNGNAAQPGTSRSSKSDCDLGGVEHLRSNLNKSQRERLLALCLKRGDLVRANNGSFSFLATVRYIDRILVKNSRTESESNNSTSIVVGLRFVSLYPPKKNTSAMVNSSTHFASEADIWNTAGNKSIGEADIYAGLRLGLAFPITSIDAVHVDKSNQFVPLRRLTNNFLNATHSGTVTA